MRILLAPMEGLLDHTLRDVLTRVGGVDLCVSEFIRVTDQLLPNRVFTRIVPELLHGGRTAAGTPVRAQLLGSDPACLADNAARLAALGPAGIDLNFGCPAPTVNRHRGGAVLLDEPELVHAIVAAVRRAVPAAMPVSAKMRLGHRDEALMLDNAHAIASAGASELVVHGRTKLHGYRPPAYWDRIAQHPRGGGDPGGGQRRGVDGRRRAALPGRERLRRADAGPRHRRRPRPGAGPCAAGPGAPGWAALLPLLLHFWQRIASHVAPRHRSGRLKQWLNLLRRRFPEAQALFERCGP